METTNKTLELEAEKQFPLVNIENPSDGVMRGNYDRLKLQQGFIAGATSTYAEKQKLEFAIKLLLQLRAAPVSEIDNMVFEFEQKLSEL